LGFLFPNDSNWVQSEKLHPTLKGLNPREFRGLAGWVGWGQPSGERGHRQEVWGVEQ